MAHTRSSPSLRPTESKAGKSRSSRSQLKEAKGPPAIRWPRYPASRSASASLQNSRARLVNTSERSASDQMASVPGVSERLGQLAEFAGAIGEHHRKTGDLRIERSEEHTSE